MLYKMTKTAVTTYYLDDVISLNDLRPIIVHALKNWTGKKIGSRIAALILEEIIDGCYEHVKKEEANELSEGTEEDVDRLVRLGNWRKEARRPGAHTHGHRHRQSYDSSPE